MGGLCLALGGGGAKGIFQIGAWEAFRDLGLEFDAIAGTSIGSVNAAFMVCDDFDGAVEMWENLRMDQCVEFSENQQARSNDLLSMKNADLLVREMIRRRSLNTDPLRLLLNRYIHEENVRNSPVRYGLMTAQLPALRPQPFWIEDIAPGQLTEHIMASAGLPGLKKVRIDGQRYVDGGFAEVVPVTMLRDQGCREVVAIDLSEHMSLRAQTLDNLRLTYIHDKQDLGGTLDITPAILNRNRRLGYLDTMKTFGRLQGDFYTFETAEYRKLLDRYGADNIRGLEQAAVAYEIDRLPVYSAQAFISLVRQKRALSEQDYIRMRQALQVDHKIKAIWNGDLKMLDMMPPMRLSFFMEMTAKARQAGKLQKVPAHLFRNLDLAAQALQAMDRVDGQAAAGDDPSGFSF